MFINYIPTVEYLQYNVFYSIDHERSELGFRVYLDESAYLLVG